MNKFNRTIFGSILLLSIARLIQKYNNNPIFLYCFPLPCLLVSCFIQVQVKVQNIHEELLQVNACFEGRPNLQLSVKPQNSSKVSVASRRGMGWREGEEGAGRFEGEGLFSEKRERVLHCSF